MTRPDDQYVDDWRHAALVCRRIIKALPDCLTPTAIQEIDMHLAAELDDGEAAAEFRELVTDAH